MDLDTLVSSFVINFGTYEMYRDFQQNTINSGGAFGMWFVHVAGVYLGHELHNYIYPWYWNRTAKCKNGEESKIRMRDAIASTLIEETFGIQISE